MEIQVIKTNDNNCQIITMMALVFVLHGASYGGNGPESDASAFMPIIHNQLSLFPRLLFLGQGYIRLSRSMTCLDAP